MILKSKKGFSLIELSIVMTIISLITVSLLNYSDVKTKYSRIKDTQKTLDFISESIESFVNLNGYLPCPAEPESEKTKSDFGRSVSCESSSFGSGVNLVTNSTNQNIIIGSVPIRELSIPNKYELDAWGNKLKYAIVKDMGVPDQNSISSFITTATDGVIKINDGLANQINRPKENSVISYVLLSHGKDGNGAFNKNGTKTNSCGTSIDSENCDDDNVFVSEEFSENNNNYYDDIIVWKTKNQLIRSSGIQADDRSSAIKYGVFAKSDSGVGAGSATSGWFKIRYDPTPIGGISTLEDVSLSSNGQNFSLKAGLYVIKASSPAEGVMEHQIRLINTDSGSTLIAGTSENSDQATNGSTVAANIQTRSFLSGVLQLTQDTEISVEHYYSTTNGNSSAKGHSTNDSGSSEVNVYSVIEIWQN